MPVSLLPQIIQISTFLILLVAAYKGWKTFILTTSGVSSVLIFIWLSIDAPGWVLHQSAERGDAASQYQYARYLENRSERINKYFYSSEPSDVLGGYKWLKKSADLEYPPALFAIGVRLKYGIHVPRPPYWGSGGGNLFRQPVLGQQYIDRAHNLGYKEPVEEEKFYWVHYRN